MNTKTAPVTEYEFGPLKVRVRGLGVYLGGEHLQAACDRLTLAELQAANKAAWKQKRVASRLMDRTSDASRFGCDPHDRASQLYEASVVVCSETWRRIVKGTKQAGLSPSGTLQPSI